MQKFEICHRPSGRGAAPPASAPLTATLAVALLALAPACSEQASRPADGLQKAQEGVDRRDSADVPPVVLLLDQSKEAFGVPGQDLLDHPLIVRFRLPEQRLAERQLLPEATPQVAQVHPGDRACRRATLGEGLPERVEKLTDLALIFRKT